MPRLLKDIRVDFISLVEKGANNKRIILKSSDDKPVFEKMVDIRKEIDGVVYGIVYAPDEIDAQGDYTTKDEIKKAAYEFLKNLSNQNVDRNHNFEKVDAFVAESWIVKKNDAVFPNEKEGSWAVGIKVEDNALIDEIKKGKITGLSMAGYAKVENIEKKDNLETILKGITEAIKSAFTKETKKEDALEEIEKSLGKGIGDIMKKIEKLDEQQKSLETNIKEIEEKVKKSKQDTTIDNEGIEGVV